jgi:hypothetical protein
MGIVIRVWNCKSETGCTNHPASVVTQDLRILLLLQARGKYRSLVSDSGVLLIHLRRQVHLSHGPGLSKQGTVVVVLTQEEQNVQQLVDDAVSQQQQLCLKSYDTT